MRVKASIVLLLVALILSSTILLTALNFVYGFDSTTRSIPKSDLANSRKLRFAEEEELMGLKLMNISCKPTPTQNELIKTVCDIIDAPMPKKHIPLWEAKLLAKLGEYYYKLKGERKPLQEYINKMASDRIFDISEAKRLIGYKPKVDIEQGIRDVIDEYESIQTRSKNKK